MSPAATLEAPTSADLDARTSEVEAGAAKAVSPAATTSKSASGAKTAKPSKASSKSSSAATAKTTSGTKTKAKVKTKVEQAAPPVDPDALDATADALISAA
ncbi:MAG: hypothetical protein FJ060_06720, partial [Cyanobacteria bacterium K_Offshore_0m_m2_072]|nr:hypothetical protein [Cyanobacteria bacterium K_Offshore_0m_m2_072]